MQVNKNHLPPHQFKYLLYRHLINRFQHSLLLLQPRIIDAGFSEREYANYIRDRLKTFKNKMYRLIYLEQADLKRLKAAGLTCYDVKDFYNVAACLKVSYPLKDIIKAFQCSPYLLIKNGVSYKQLTYYYNQRELYPYLKYVKRGYHH